MLVPVEQNLDLCSAPTPVEPDVSWLIRWSPGHNPGGTRGYRIHPAELRRHRDRCEPIVNSLRDWKRQLASVCNVCGSERRAIVVQPDRYGCPSRTTIWPLDGQFFRIPLRVNGG